MDPFPPYPLVFHRPFTKFKNMKLFRVLTAIFFSGIVCSAFAQDEYPAEVDSAWIASQNGGSTELNDGNNEETPACIGDGCDGTETVTTSESGTATSTEGETAVAAKEKSSGNESDEEDCTPADSLLPECKEDKSVSRYDDDDDDTYDRYANENAELSRASREGFSNGFSLGFRFGGGFNMILIGSEIDGWRLGYEATAGIVAQTKIGIPEMALSVGLQFSYFRYRYENSAEDEDYSEKDEATLNVVLFEVPAIVKYTFESNDITIGAGFNLGIKLTGSSKFEQTIATSTVTENPTKEDNPIPTAGVELSGIFEVGYIVNRNFVVDLRLLQRFTNLLYNDVVEVSEAAIKKASLYGLHVTLGATLYL